MRQESIVYGCIRDTVYERDVEQRLIANRRAMDALPGADSWPMLSREMFSLTAAAGGDIDVYTEVVHFGASYQGIEYEWELWLEQFETLLVSMYWVSATVHLETELSGLHSFNWVSDDEYHRPGGSNIRMRCEWVREM